MAQDFERLNIQWFPGHMTKAQRMIEEHMKQVDAVCEILDARIPMASRNPDIDRLAGDKPRIVVLNRTDLADPKATARWRAVFQRLGMTVRETDSRSGKGVNGFSGAVRTALHDKIEAYAAKGQVGRAMRVMVLGIPNVGKSSLINKLVNRKALARVSATPGKTATINFFRLPECRFVDLPGYGYAKVSQSEKQRWAKLMQGYFDAERNVALGIQILDMRHEPTADDFDMINFLIERDLPFLVVCTKSDKLNKTQFNTQNAYFEDLFREHEIPFIPYSSQTGFGLETLKQHIEAAVLGN